MGPIGRIKRCAVLLERLLDETFAEFGLSRWEFDMRYSLAPTTLFSTLMVTSGTMTHRMTKLEAQGWIERLPNPADARSSLVQLTPQGLELIDRAVEAHVANEHRILSALKAADIAALDARLALLLASLESRRGL
jgi:DNA-binding MarR family transcriptional regulator